MEDTVLEAIEKHKVSFIARIFDITLNVIISGRRMRKRERRQRHKQPPQKPPSQKPTTKEKPRTYREKCAQAAIDLNTKTLFDELPFKNHNITEEEDKLFACIQYIPEIAHQMRNTLTKAGINTTFTSGTSLKNLLCGGCPGQIKVN